MMGSLPSLVIHKQEGTFASTVFYQYRWWNDHVTVDISF